MRRALAILALLSLALGAGCTFGPDHRRPEVPTPESFTDSEPAESVANLPWWEVFGDPTLQELVEIALTENQDLLAATWRIEEARAQYGFVRSDGLPSIGASATVERIGPSDEVLGPTDDFSNHAVGLAASWELDLWGRFRRQNEVARAELLATEWGRRSLVVALVAEVARGYILLRDLDTRLEIAERTLASRVESTRIIRQRFDGGIVSELDVRQAEIEEATARVAVPAFRRQTRIVENALRLLLGRAPGEIPRGEELSKKDLPDDPPVGLPSELLERRPDIVRAEAVLRSSTARIGVAEALRFPSLSLTGFLGLQSEQLSDIASGETWSVGADLLGPIYEFDRNVERVAAERARAEQAVLAYEATVLSAFRDVEDALVSFRTLREEYDARLAQVTASRQAQVLSRARYDGGVTSYLEVLDIERSLFQSELETSRTLGEHLSALVDLYASLGGGWDPEEEVILPASRLDPPEE